MFGLRSYETKAHEPDVGTTERAGTSCPGISAATKTPVFNDCAAPKAAGQVDLERAI